LPPDSDLGGLFGPTFSTDAMRAAVSDRAWLQAMLDVEAALAAAEAKVGLIPEEAAAAIAGCCQADRFDVDAIGRGTVSAGTPIIPLVAALTAAVPGDAARYVHWGATTQDVMDTAAMLLCGRGLDLLVGDLGCVTRRCAELADAHRATVMPGRTLLQQALPITFGLKAAGWLVATIGARARLVELRERGLAVQFGGAAGTLAALGSSGIDVMHELSAQLGLPEPPLPWHTARGRVAEIGAALGVAAGSMGKIARDLALMAQTEVAEVAEPSAPGRGGSSTLPHKRNPVGAMEVDACVRRVHSLVGVLLGAMVQEHERAAGAWQAEWETLPETFRLTAGAVDRVKEVLEGLQVFPERMRVNLEATHGLMMSEHVMMVLAERIGRSEAHDLVDAACVRAAGAGRHLREELLADPTISAHLSPAEVDAALDPAGYLGSADAFIDRALTAYRTTDRGAEGT
jgi:3-carboxy-cis,cis-muconate cycloisomerase